jgi:hypothetical protein
MDFNEAIADHTRWKMRLASYAVKPDHSLCVKLVASADQCELEQWLEGEGSKYSSLPEFADLVASHARFHQAAAEIVINADSGRVLLQDIASEAKGNFIMASNEIVKALMSMMKKMLVAQ